MMNLRLLDGLSSIYSSKTKIKEGESGISYLVAGKLILVLFKS